MDPAWRGYAYPLQRFESSWCPHSGASWQDLEACNFAERWTISKSLVLTKLDAWETCLARVTVLLQGNHRTLIQRDCLSHDTVPVATPKRIEHGLIIDWVMKSDEAGTCREVPRPLKAPILEPSALLNLKNLTTGVTIRCVSRSRSENSLQGPLSGPRLMDLEQRNQSSLAGHLAYGRICNYIVIITYYQKASSRTYSSISWNI